MNLVRKSIRTNPPFGELNDPPLPADGQVLFEEEFCREPIRKSRKKPRKQEEIVKPKKQEEIVKPKKEKRILKSSSKEEFTHADHVERMIIDEQLYEMLSTSSTLASAEFLEATSNKQRRRQSSILTGEHSHRVERFLNDEDNDWFFEKLLEKFENLRSRKVRRHDITSLKNIDDDGGSVAYGVERIIERRYYIKKPPLIPKRSQLTSTSDLTTVGKKTRQPSGGSSLTTASCSQCSSSTPTYVEDLRGQSNSLRYEISGLKNDIEQLQTSQREFFQQIQTHMQSNTVLTTIPENFNDVSLQSSANRNEDFANRQVFVATNQLPRSISTETLTTTSSESTMPRLRSNTQNTPLRPISEFIATKNPTIASTLPFRTPLTAKPPSIPPIPTARTQFGSKPSSIAPTPPVNTYFGSKPSSIAPTPPVNASPALKPPSAAPTPPILKNNDSKPPVAEYIPVTNSSITSAPTPTESMSSKVSTEVRTPPKRASPPPPPSSARIPIYENEVAYRRILSPRSQIVASAASAFGSSESSSESTSSSTNQSTHSKFLKTYVPTLRDNDLNNLAQYSSQLEVSGFPPSTIPVITNPNTSSIFWDSVDDYLENSRSTNTIMGLSPTSRSQNGLKSEYNHNTTKQLEKYDLEIKPQEIYPSSAPFLMPPLDT